MCCTHHTARAGREQGVPYTAAAVSFRWRRRDEERYWLGLCGSIGWLLICCHAAGAACALEGGEGGSTHNTHHTTNQQHITLVPRRCSTTAVLCTSLHSLWARGCVASAAAVAVKRWWWKLEASCSNHQHQTSRKKFSSFFFSNVIFF